MEKERRKFKRFDAYMSVKFKLEEPKSMRGICLSKDLSREGMKIATNENLASGALLDLEIDIPDDPKPVSTTGKVVWQRKLAGGERNYEYGVRFVSMDPVDKFRVLDYAYNHWLETKINDFSDPERIPEIN